MEGDNILEKQIWSSLQPLARKFWLTNQTPRRDTHRIRSRILILFTFTTCCHQHYPSKLVVAARFVEFTLSL